MALAGRRGLTFDEMASKGLLGDPSRSKPSSLRHTLSVYRRQLEGIGIHLETIGEAGPRRYRIDAARTYADLPSIAVSAHDATLLSAVLEAYLEGTRSTPSSSDARRAYNKLMGLIGLEPSDNLETTSQSTARSKALSLLTDASMHRHPVSFLYAGAAAPQRMRSVRIYGTFVRRGHTYLVGTDEELMGPEGQGSENPMRVFRDDRIDPKSIKVAKARTYDVPAGFRSSDYAKLPFQYGQETPFVATFLDSVGLSTEQRENITEHKGSWNGDMWSIEANDLAALASWAAGSAGLGLIPVGPDALLTTLTHGLEEATHIHGTPGR